MSDRPALLVTVAADTVTFSLTRAGGAPAPVAVPVGPAALGRAGLDGTSDPPAPEDLTNALGAVADHVDDVAIAVPEVVDAPLHIAGRGVWHLVTVEAGHDPGGDEVVLDRAEVEEVFRAVATETREDRRHNPGLDPDQVDSIIAVCCVVLGTMRRLGLEAATFHRDAPVWATA